MNNNFKCHNCGDIDYVLLDGYSVGDRLLEGVMFEIRRDGQGYKINVSAEDANYFSDLNEQKWLAKILKYASSTDYVTCPKCSSGDVDWPQ